MTYSHATRSWVMAQMDLCIFGRETIARAACVHPRTISTWQRQEESKLPFSNKMPKEYERGMGIVLCEYYPHLMPEISKSLRAPQRTIREWVYENKYKQFTSDLRLRTYEGVMKLKLVVNPNLSDLEARHFLSDWRSWPDAEWLYRSVWREYDENLRSIISTEFSRWFLKEFGQDSLYNPKIPIGWSPIRFVGPHVNRHAGIASKTKFRRDNDFLKKRVVGRLRDGGLGFYKDHCGASEYLTANRELPTPKFYMKEFQKYIIQEKHFLTLAMQQAS